MQFHTVTVHDRKRIDTFLHARRHELSVYAFPAVFIWKGLYEISWAVISGALCIFFRDRLGCFMFLPPLGAKDTPDATEQAFAQMNKLNSNPHISRIENIEEQDRLLYERAGFALFEKPADYLYQRQELAELQGDAFKAKRANCNYCAKQYAVEYRPYQSRFKQGCLQLYRSWCAQRKKTGGDALYRGMLDDSFSALSLLLDNYSGLGVAGRVVILDERVQAFTFGYPLDTTTFCILFEITELNIRGLAQYIFRQVCRELKEYTYINCMDDSGLENLKKVKRSYRPLRLVPAYIAIKKGEG